MPKISICLNRDRQESVGNDDVSTVCARKYANGQDDVKTENPEGTPQVDFVTLIVTFIVQSYLDTLLRYVLSDTFCGAVVWKVMEQKTLAKRR